MIFSIWQTGYLVLFDVLLLHRLEVGSQVHGALVFGAQESSHHLVGRHPHLPQRRLLELAPKILHLQLQLVDLMWGGGKKQNKHTHRSQMLRETFSYLMVWGFGGFFEVERTVCVGSNKLSQSIKVILFLFLVFKQNKETFLFNKRILTQRRKMI